MATRISPGDRHTTVGQHPGMERSIAISAPTVGAEIAIERSIPACWPIVVCRSAGEMRVAIGR